MSVSASRFFFFFHNSTNISYFWLVNLFWIPVLQVVSPFPPSDKIGINSVQREAEEIIPMKQMKMDWVPYIPLEDRYGIPIVYCWVY